MAELITLCGWLVTPRSWQQTQTHVRARAPEEPIASHLIIDFKKKNKKKKQVSTLSNTWKVNTHMAYISMLMSVCFRRGDQGRFVSILVRYITVSHSVMASCCRVFLPHTHAHTHTHTQTAYTNHYDPINKILWEQWQYCDKKAQ